MFVYYLKRHIELDGENHGPAAARIIRQITHDDQGALQQLNAAAANAIDDRITLWDELVRTLHREDHRYQREQTGPV
jgi:phage FluMu protein gp41